MNQESRDNKEKSINKDAGTRKASRTAADSSQTPAAKEVFDSSKYNAMNDMTKGASADQFTVRQAMTELQKKELLDFEEIQNKSIASPTEPSNLPEPRSNPMMVEERARTIREINEEATPVRNTGEIVQESEDVNVVEHMGYGYYEFVPDWIEKMMRYYTFFSPYAMFMFSRQYYEMANLGSEVYSQYLKNYADSIELWFKPWYGIMKQ